MDDAVSNAAQSGATSPETKTGRSEAGNNRTRRTYRAGWDQWLKFTDERGTNPVPVAAGVVIDFMEWLSMQERPDGTVGYTPNTVDTYLTAVAVAHQDVEAFLSYLQILTVEDEHGAERRRYSDQQIQQYRAAVAHAHTQPGSINPIRSEAVRKRREALHETTDYETSTRAPVLLKHLNEMPFDEDQVSDLRDRALLHIGFGGAFRRSELVAVQHQHIRDVEGGIGIYIPDSDGDQSDADQAGPGRLPRFPNEAPGFRVSPIDTLQSWMDAAGITSGPVFRGVDRWGNVREEKALSGNSFYRIVQKWMGHIGHEPERYGARSLRIGFMAQCEIDDIPQLDMMQQAGYKSGRISYGYGESPVMRSGFVLARLGTAADDRENRLEAS